MVPWITGLALFVAIGVAAWAIAEPADSGLSGLILLAGLAILLFIGFYVLATGGLAHLIAAETETIERVEPFLTLDGLRILFERNAHEPPA